MNIESEIWTPVEGDESGEARMGEILVDVVGDEEITILFRIDGEVVSSAQIDRFMVGILVGALATAASAAVAA